ncbi:MAG: 6,7-dimethyl-8-ribityllumazine synthase [Thaumarchaeota archaeon]|nr:6,7-dimethyl-8-ribityllumazine synthase [Nitrososphaerota archaeon]
MALECSVSGTFDIPPVADALLARDDVDAVVALGAVIKGQTKHDEVISHATASALLAISVARSKPASLGITGPAMRERQAYARIRPAAERAVDAAIASHAALREARA